MGILYRPHRQDDLQRLRQLWSESSNWGDISDDTWRTHVLDAPDGGLFICVATDEADQILGAMTFIRQRVILNGREVKAVRPFAPIVSDALRKQLRSLNPLDHPVVKMAKRMEGLLRDEGFALSFMLPDPHWKLLFRLMPGVRFASFPLWSLGLPLKEPFTLRTGYVAESFADWGEPADQLWKRASVQFDSGIVRDSQRLQRYSGPPDFDVLGVRRDGELVGLVCSRKHGDRQWLICDTIAVDAEALRETLAAACNLAHARALSEEKGALVKTALLVTPSLLEIVKDLGFHRDRYDFTLVVRVLDQTLNKHELDVSRWYLSAND